MAPKRRSGRAVKTVVTTTKVVEETVKVVVGPNGDESEPVELLSSSTKENRDIIITEPVSKTVPVQEKPDQQEEADIGDDDDETQPTSQPEVTPAPPEPAAGAQKPVGPSTPREDREKMKKKQKVAGKEKPAAAAAAAGGEGRKRRRRRGGGGPEGYKRYVWKVMKQVHPEMGMSSKAMTVVNNLMVDMFERLAEEAARLQGHAGRKTMSSREIQAAVKLVLPGELGKHAIAEGTKAVTNYVSYVA
ncbi:histone H2B [Striga asiatica]|uniref:Histone H2B n=1 Tax=Striga asiatica TaxID=4170 RepID=A0A5A7REX7_STRAF|nr:histone H2B [Striga asiatica]